MTAVGATSFGTANALFAVHLDALGRERGLRAFSLHPGKILTPLQRHLRQEEMIDAGWIDAEGKVADPDFKTPAQGAATQVWAATSPRLANLGGVYCEEVDIARIVTAGGPLFEGVRDYAVDRGEAERLWKISADLTGVNALG